jgi:hypothetical protein
MSQYQSWTRKSRKKKTHPDEYMLLKKATIEIFLIVRRPVGVKEGG